MKADEHQRRFENTEALLGENSMDVKSSQHFDWLAVIMYYGAVHLVERKFAMRKKPFHSKEHPERNKEARSLKAGATLQSDLLLLYDASLDARYNAIFYSRDDIVELDDAYGELKVF